jgi:hypothetical protein
MEFQGTSLPAPLMHASGPGFEPLHADEIDAFQRALMAGSSMPTPVPTAADQHAAAINTAAIASAAAADLAERQATRQAADARALLLTGYEDTEIKDPDAPPVLSQTQYGELR